LKKIASILFGCILGLAMIEFMLNIYNPYQSRIEGNKYKLLSNYHRKILLTKNHQANGLDSIIDYSTNSLGFRGSELPISRQKYYRIFTVGGSTTECSLIDNKKTWSYLLNDMFSPCDDSIWINNAGIDGSTTIGHDILLKEHLIKHQPDMIIFLVGINDLFRAKFNFEDALVLESNEVRLKGFVSKSKLYSFLRIFYHQYFPKQIDFNHKNTNKKVLNYSESEFLSLDKFYKRDQKKYKERLTTLMKICQKNNIKPVFVTQPIFKTNERDLYSFVKIYNQSTREISKVHGIHLIDLAIKLEENTNFYYDRMHYNNLGNEKVAEIIHNELADLLCDN